MVRSSHSFIRTRRRGIVAGYTSLMELSSGASDVLGLALSCTDLGVILK